MFQKVAQLVAASVYTYINLFQNSQKVTNLFGPLLKANWLFLNIQNMVNLVTLDTLAGSL